MTLALNKSEFRFRWTRRRKGHGKSEVWQRDQRASRHRSV